MFEQDLNIGEVVSNDRIHDIFGCQTQGGIRLSNLQKRPILLEVQADIEVFRCISAAHIERRFEEEKRLTKK